MALSHRTPIHHALKYSLHRASLYQALGLAPSLCGKPWVPSGGNSTSIRSFGHTKAVYFDSKLQKGSNEVDELKPFEYVRLNPNNSEIRILTVLPSKQPSDKINCTMTTVPLDSKPTYSALSYVWGDPVRTQPIFLNGRLFRITVNLEIFLKHWRATKPDMKPLWIDAICINQDDNVEKSTEIQRLQRIFKQAWIVIAWLGPSSPSTIVAMKTMNEFVDFYLQSDKSLQASADDFANSFGGEKNNWKGIEEVQILMQRQWFQRVWIVQEIAVARKIHYLCGQESAPGELIPTFVSAIENTALKEARNLVEDLIWEDGGTSVIIKWDLEWNGTKFYRLVDLVTRKESAPTLWELLLAFKACSGQATDPRDHVFALLGLAGDAGKLGLRPDYSLSVADCYTQVAKAFLCDGCMRLLWLCEYQDSELHLPSWVPDWSSHWSLQPTPWELPGEFPGLEIEQTPQDLFSASGSSEPMITFQGTNGDVLRISGFEVDNICKAGPSYMPLITQLRHTTPNERVITMMSNSAKPFKELQRRYTVLRALRQEKLICPMNEVDYVAIRTLLRDTDMAVSTTTYSDSYFSRENLRWTRLSSHTLDEIGKTLHQEWAKEIEAALPWPDLLIQSDRRRPFVTTTGRLGLGPDSLEKGDKIVVLLGAELPFVLRETNPGQHMLVGAAYVDGIMDGETLAMKKSLRDFDIH